MFELLRELQYPPEFRVLKFRKKYSLHKLLKGGEGVERWIEEWIQNEELKTIAQADVVCDALTELLEYLQEERKGGLKEDELARIALTAWRIKKKVLFFERRFGERGEFQIARGTIKALFSTLSDLGIWIYDPEGEPIDPRRRDIKFLASEPYNGDKKVYLAVQEPAIYIREKLIKRGSATIGIPKR
ncbi:MAG TPA: hypothetical protein EYP78_01065 [Candidatus Omnitrophica bacterium]|nr:hypothetical protein [Candidatus Omnitrophota bacterium]